MAWEVVGRVDVGKTELTAKNRSPRLVEEALIRLPEVKEVPLDTLFFASAAYYGATLLGQRKTCPRKNDEMF